MRRDIVFRGCTRPPMFLGVPYIPFFIGAGVPLLFAMYFNLFFMLLIPLVIIIMRQIAKYDEMIFRLWGLKLQFSLLVRRNKEYKNLYVLSPNQYRGK